MTDQEYQGVHCVLLKAGNPFAVAEMSVKIKRGVASHARSGKWSDLKLPGKIDITGSIKRIMVNADLLRSIITATPATGAAETLHAGLTCPGSGAESITDMTDTSIASASRIRLTATGGPVTGSGTAILYGTDANGNTQTETLAITTIAENSYVTSSRTFLTLTHIALIGVTMGAGDTLAVASITGSSTATVGAPEEFDAVGYCTKNGEGVRLEMDDCFITDAEFKFSDADSILEDSVSFTMKDPDAGFRVI